MTAIPANRVLPSKDSSNYRSALKLYESKQYKKSIKAADNVLKNFPNHGETLAVKGLSLAASNKKIEGLELIRKGLSNDITSHVCWHILGLYYKTEKNYEEAVKAFSKAHQLDPKNLNILRDLSLLQTQVRQFDNLVLTRAVILKDQPGYRMNWTALAVAQHLSKDFTAAVKTLDNFTTLLKETPPKSDQEHSELLMYKNFIIWDSGAVQEALNDLNEIEDKISDKQGFLETKASYLLKLEKYDQALKIYQILLARNPECVEYYQLLERALKLTDEDSSAKIKLYTSLIEKYPKSDAPQSILLNYLNGNDPLYDKLLRKYIGNYIKRGVPGAFGFIKRHYDDEEKRSIITNYVENDMNPERIEGEEEWFWAQNFKAHHYSKLGKLDAALETITAAIAQNKNEKLVELYMTKARILKKMGDYVGASEIMEETRKFDLSDRFLNTKSTKYLLRADKINEAIDVVSLFTKNEVGGNGIHDLIDMQALWFLTEQATSYNRLGDMKMALNRLIDIFNIYAEFYTDQYDFHYYACRRGTMRNYVRMIQWADKLYADKTYVKSAELAIRLCIEYYDASKNSDGIVQKKASKTRKSKESTNETIDKDLEAFTDGSSSVSAALRAASKFLAPLEKDASDEAITWELAFEIAYRQETSSLAIRAINRAKGAGIRESWLISSVSIAKKLLQSQTTTPAELIAVQMNILNAAAPNTAVDFDGNANEYLDTLLTRHDAQAIIDWTNAKIYINGLSAVKKQVEEQLLSISNMKVDLEMMRSVYFMLEKMSSERLNEFKINARNQWPKANFLKTE